jgi:hypothetical protein
MSDSIYLLLSRYTQPTVIVLGTLGAIFNQILFYKRKSLRTTSCSLYFRALSVNDLLVLYVYVLFQWLADQYGFDPTRKYDWYCKVKTFLNSGLYTLSPYLVVLACFDRLCTSSTNTGLRRIASIRVASYVIPSAVIFVFVAYFHSLVWYQLVVTPYYSMCTVINPTYNKVIPAFLIIFLALLPPMLMMIFCGVTFVLLRQQRRRVMPINQARARQRDNQLLKMLSIYVVSHLVCTIPFSVTFIILVYQLSALSPTIILLLRCFILLFNLNFATSFYIYTLGTPFYRRELYSLIAQMKIGARKMLRTDALRGRARTIAYP